MLDWTANSLRLPVVRWVGSLTLILAFPVAGQAPPPVQSAQFDPSDVYFQGYLATRTAEQLESTGDFIGALEKLEKANQLFGAVRKYYPDWKPAMVSGRSEKTVEAVAKVRKMADEQLQKNRNQVAELEGGVKISGTPLPPKTEVLPLTPGILEVNPLAARRLADAEAEVKRLRELTAKANQDRETERLRAANLERKLSAGSNQNTSRLRELEQQRQAESQRAADLERKLSAGSNQNTTRLRELEQQRQAASQRAADLERKLSAGSNQNTTRLRELEQQRQAELQRDSSRLRDVERQRDALQSDLRTAENNLTALRARLAAAPVENEMKSLNQRIETLEQEREAMAMALTQSRSAHTEAMARNATLEADLKVMQQQHSEVQQKLADLDRNLKTERKIANSVVAGQRRQLDALEKALETKTSELAKANERIGGLMNELKESQDAYAQLRTERNSLLQERDQMSALLKLNEAGRIQDLIEQNMSLAKNLREANEKVERLNRESNANQDATIDALRDLAIAKSQINRLHQDKRDQDKRLADLEARLKNEEEQLAKNQASSDPQEVALLRDIIKRQLRVQERRRQARDLLVEAAKELGTKDERLAKAIELFDTQEIALSPEEQKLIADKQVDGEFVSPFARDRAAVGKSTSELNRDIAVFERTAEKSFLAGRLLPTRELYQMILEQHPGHTPSLCKLGIVHLKLDEASAAAETFRRAVELDGNNPYAFRMLGFSLMKLGDLPAAEQAVRHSVDLAPNDAKSRMLLAILCCRFNRIGEAESHFKAAITADPVPSEPYYNLALLYSRDGRREQARDFYQQALERGTVPDPTLEEKLDKP